MGGRTSAASHNKYISKAYDRINLTVKKGEKDILKRFAADRGESVNAFINRAIRETMEREGGERDDGKRTVESD